MRDCSRCADDTCIQAFSLAYSLCQPPKRYLLVNPVFPNIILGQSWLYLLRDTYTSGTILHGARSCSSKLDLISSKGNRISLQLPLGHHEPSPCLMEVKAEQSSLPLLEIHPQFLPGVLAEWRPPGLASQIESDDFARSSETDPPRSHSRKNSGP